MIPSHNGIAEAQREKRERRTPHSSIDLFLVSFLILFLELACIRWFGSTVVFLTFFTNIVLLATLPRDVGRLSGRLEPAEPDDAR